MSQLPVPAEVAEASRSLGLGASAPELHGGLCGAGIAHFDLVDA